MLTRSAVVLLALGFCLPLACASTAPLPPKAVELNRAGTEALREGDLETAGARFSLALEYSPRFVEAVVNLALVEQERGNLERARHLLERARELNPDVAQPHHGLGVLAERLGQNEAASKHYFEALAVDPGFAPARANLGRLFFEAGDYERARIQFKRLVEVAPDEVQGHAGLTSTLLKLHRTPEADATLAKALKRFESDPQLRLLQARRLLRQGKLADAKRELAALSQRSDAVGTAALGWLATAEVASGDLHAAAQTARRALDRQPHQAVAVYALALALTELGDPRAPAWRERARQLTAEPVAR